MPVKVVLESGAIRPGDLLTSSSTPGHAMRGVELWRGGIVGVALIGFAGKGAGKVLVFLQPRSEPAADARVVAQLQGRIADLESRLRAIETQLAANPRRSSPVDRLARR